MSFLARAFIVERARRAGCADISKNFDSVAHPRSVQSNSNERGRPRRALSRFVAMARRAGRLRVAHARPCAFERIRRRMRGRRVKGRLACPGCGRWSGRGGATIGAPWIAERGMRRFCMRRAGGGFKPRRVPPCAAMCRPPCASARRLGAMRAAWALARAISRSRMKRFRAGAALRVCGAGSIFSASEATWRRPSSR